MSLISRDLYRFDEFELQPSARTLTRLGEKVSLAPKTFEVLACLVERSGRVVSKDELLKTVWPESFVEESNLTQHVFSLRKALGDKAEYIATVPGRGYQFTAEVSVVSESETMNSSEMTLPGLRIQRAVERTHIVTEELRQTPLPLFARRWFWPGVAAGLLVVLGASVWGVRWWHHRVVPGDHHEVVVADFDNSTGDPDFDKALRTLLVIDLNDSPSLQVASGDDTSKILKLMNRDPESNMPVAVAREVCERMNDQVVVSGLIARFGQNYLITLKATDCVGGKDLVQTKAVARSRDDVIHAVDSVASDMRARLGEPLASLKPGQPLYTQHTFSLDALRAYSEAHKFEDLGDFKSAGTLFQKAIDLDPNFASAYAELSNCLLNQHESIRAREVMAKAYELRDMADGPDRQNIVVYYEYNLTGDRHAAIRAFQDWTNMYPLQFYPVATLGRFQSLVGPLSESVKNEKRAVELRPDDPELYSRLALYQMYDGDLEGAKATCHLGAARKVDTTELHGTLLVVAFLQHDKAGVDDQLAWVAKNADAEDRENVASQMDLSQGKYRSTYAHVLNEVAMETNDGNMQAATGNLASMAGLYAGVGMKKDAIALLKHFVPTPHMSITAWTNVIMAAAKVGDIDLAEKLLAELKEKNPHRSDVNEVYGGLNQASIDLARGKPLDAIEAMKLAEPYEYTDTPEVPLMRGDVYLAAKMPELAQREYLFAIEHPYYNPISQETPLGHLGLARALSMGGNLPAAKQEYETFFELWKDADADLPIMAEARSEYKNLTMPHKLAKA